MPRSLNISLPDAMRRYVDDQAGNDGLYATPSEYVRELVRKDMASRDTLQHVLGSLDDLKHGRMSEKSILDIHDEN